jgi:hypothetical protein
LTRIFLAVWLGASVVLTLLALRWWQKRQKRAP